MLFDEKGYLIDADSRWWLIFKLDAHLLGSGIRGREERGAKKWADGQSGEGRNEPRCWWLLHLLCRLAWEKKSVLLHTGDSSRMVHGSRPRSCKCARIYLKVAFWVDILQDVAGYGSSLNLMNSGSSATRYCAASGPASHHRGPGIDACAPLSLMFVMRSYSMLLL